MKKKAIITGANGFVGSAVARELSQRDYYVYAIVKDTNEDISELRDVTNIEIIYCSLDQFEKIGTNEQLFGADMLYHFAWIGVSDEKKLDIDTQLLNVKYTLKVIQIAKELNVKKIIFASSVTEYECAYVLKKEVTPPTSCYYSCAKAMANGFAKTFSNTFDIDYIQIVISNIYGQGDKSNRFLNANIKKMLNKEDTYFTAASQTYDFIHINDAKKAIRLIGEQGRKNKVYYLGSAKPMPLVWFLEIMRDEIDPAIKLGIGKISHHGISLDYESEFDINSVKKDTGFIPEISFKEGIKQTIEYIKSNRNI